MYKIMLADDEGIVIDSLKYIIEKEFKDECMIEYAKTGRSVIELAYRFQPDIAIMDIQMPGINGIDAMKEMNEFNHGTIYIVVSAYDKFDYAKEAINLGVLEYLNKPVEKERFLEVLKRAMRLLDKEREKRSINLEIREKMETVIPIIENGFISTLLTRGSFNEDIMNFKNLLGLTDSYGYMMVIASGEEQEGSRLTNYVGTSICVEQHMKEVSETIRDYFPGILSNLMGNKIAVFLSSPDKKQDYEQRTEMIDRAREMIRRLMKKMEGLRFRVGFGSLHRMEDALDSYNEALNALNQTSDMVSHADDLPIGCRYEEDYPIEEERMLFQAVQKGDTKGALAAANTFFDWMESEHASYLEDIRLKALEFVLWAEHLAYESGGMTYHFKSRSEYLSTLMRLKDCNEIRRWYAEKIEIACRNVMIKKGEQSISIVEQAKIFIAENYRNEISLDEVSKKVDVSPYYFSKVFKRETGKNFVEFLTEVRMEKAKELLKQSNHSIKEICMEIGYSDPNYFSRTFKKNQGVTPTEYKEEN